MAANRIGKMVRVTIIAALLLWPLVLVAAAKVRMSIRPSMLLFCLREPPRNVECFAMKDSKSN
jgi:hypothetical protein